MLGLCGCLSRCGKSSERTYLRTAPRLIPSSLASYAQNTQFPHMDLPYLPVALRTVLSVCFARHSLENAARKRGKPNNLPPVEFEAQYVLKAKS